MAGPVKIAAGDRDLRLADLALPIDLERLLPAARRDGPAAGWEVEIGFGKGRYLLRRAAEDPLARFLGIEIAGRYLAIARRRMRRRGLRNLALLHGEALFLLAVALPRGFARAVHVYFPDPWPKSRQRRRRLFDCESVDLVLGLLRPGGVLAFATDHLEYGGRVRELLESHRGVEVRELGGCWPEGPRTNYEAKYVAEGRPIVRLEATAGEAAGRLHPAGAAGVLAATALPSGAEDSGDSGA